MRRSAFGNVNDYEIMLMLDPELAEERANEIIQRIRDSVEGDGGTWDGHEPWGRRSSPTRSTTRAEGVYHLLLFRRRRRRSPRSRACSRSPTACMRHLAVRRVKGGHTKAPAAGAAVSAPADDAGGAAE